MQAELAEHNIFARKYFYPSLENIRAYEGRGYRADVPVSDWAADHVLCLPIHAGLDTEAVNRICDVVLG